MDMPNQEACCQIKYDLIVVALSGGYMCFVNILGLLYCIFNIIHDFVVTITKQTSEINVIVTAYISCIRYLNFSMKSTRKE